MDRKQYLLLVAVTIVGGLIGGAVFNWVLTDGSAVAQGSPIVQNIIKARRVEIIDGAGSVRGMLGMVEDSDYAVLAFYDNDSSRPKLSISPVGLVKADESGAIEERAIANMQAAKKSTERLAQQQNVDTNGNKPGWIGRFVNKVSAAIFGIGAFIGAVICALVKALWDYVKLGVSNKNEIKRISMSKFFEHAQKYYFGILHVSESLGDDMEAMCTRGEASDTSVNQAFYSLAQYLRETSRFAEEAGMMWFLTDIDREEKLVEAQELINQLIPFGAIEGSYLVERASRPDDYSRPISRYQFHSLLENDDQLSNIHSEFRNWLECQLAEPVISSGNSELAQLCEVLSILSCTITSDLNSAFKAWYK